MVEVEIVACRSLAVVDAYPSHFRGALAVMAVVQTAMLAGMPYPGLRDAIFTHATMAEGLVFLFANIPPRVVS